MEDNILDLRNQDSQRIKEIKRTTEILFKVNHTLPCSDEYQQYLKELFTGGMGKGCYIAPPLYINIASHLHMGNHVSLNPFFKCMAAGHVYIDDNVQIAMGVSIITNNHDAYERSLLTIKDVHIKKNVWIGANATILPGIHIGENAIVGAGSVVTHDVKANSVVVGNPAKMIKMLDSNRFETNTK